ncbi:Sorbitol dehydrogenase [Caenorhabditis elegans]|uniref:Sorbitol dehydrogenase n=1 Tax=Caenorhabditis elegans TaxID=6239 RepID=Q21703_CAEEL|nr:Sorbitol dehydrogenase [Caenorhabditis elegans]CAA94842.1 Sorbitol dehydrogenase [Caenorhabditis elegans]|eukprot:NP_505590.1 Uncharacterized protein CELE_R04B5.6 [Caenorhabditis elegans]
MSQDNLSAVLYGINDLRLEQAPISKPGPRQVLVKINTVGICGSDVHFLTHGAIGSFVVKEPMVLGHESSGVVSEIGSEVKGFKVGDRIAMEPGLPCKLCEHCKIGRYNLCPDMRFFATPPVNGALSRFVVHDADFCFKLPDNLSFEDGALLEPLSVAIQACRRGTVQMGQKILVLGAGPIGVLNLLTAKAIGASKVVITDLNDERLALARLLGADATINVMGKRSDEVRSEIIKAFGDQQPHVSIECTGVQPCVETAIMTTRSGGVVVLVGLGAERVEIPLIQSPTREVDLRGTFRSANCYSTAIELISSGKLDLSGLTRAHYKLEESLEAFKRTQNGDVIKVFIHC